MPLTTSPASIANRSSRPFHPTPRGRLFFWAAPYQPIVIHAHDPGGTPADLHTTIDLATVRCPAGQGSLYHAPTTTCLGVHSTSRASAASARLIQKDETQPVMGAQRP